MASEKGPVAPGVRLHADDGKICFQVFLEREAGGALEYREYPVSRNEAIEIAVLLFKTVGVWEHEEQQRQKKALEQAALLAAPTAREMQ